MKNEISTFIHQVYFWQKDAESKTDLARLILGLKTLQKIEVIKGFHIGTPAQSQDSDIDRSYSVSLLVSFDDAKDEKLYQAHPIHMKFVEDCGHLFSKVKVYDSLQVPFGPLN